MKKLQQQKGFTLVELAIVLTIVGLLIGGILKGQQLIANAQVTAQIAQFKSVEAALVTFNDMFSALPGDMSNASAVGAVPGRLPATGCGGSGCANGNGDGVMGTPATAPTKPASPSEELTFWGDLGAANLIAGIAGSGVTWGSGLPSAKFTGAGLWANTLTSTAAPFIYTGGIWVSVVPSPNTAPLLTQGNGVMTPNQAAQIDRKVDDGIPTTGSVIGAGTGNCTAAAGYTESATTKDCLVSYKVQN